LRDVGVHTFLDNRLIFGGELFSFTCRPLFTPRKILVTHLCQRLSRPQDHSQAGWIMSIEKSTELFGNRTCGLLACNITPQPIIILTFKITPNTSILRYTAATPLRMILRLFVLQVVCVCVCVCCMAIGCSLIFLLMCRLEFDLCPYLITLSVSRLHGVVY
jgi:hypothetical protein